MTEQIRRDKNGLLIYNGEMLREKVTFDSPSWKWNGLDAFELDPKKPDRPERLSPYLPGLELIEIVKLAQILKRPVLLKGEPGCGKTQLARAVAFEWYKKDYRSKFFEWNIKSSSRASEGIYTFDHLERLRQANMAAARAAAAGAPLPEETADDLERRYLRLGPLAHALLTSQKDWPSILLIDEIDKADIDFPNDLLLELDEARSVIREAGLEKAIAAPDGARPVVFITSNNERELPAAFLRRCLFFYIEFPKKPQLLKILKAHLPKFFDIKGKEDLETDPKMVGEAVDLFIELRKRVEADPSVSKMPSTSELIDWAAALYFHLKPDPDLLFGTIADKKIPFFQTLLKSRNDLTREQGNIFPQPPKP